MRLFTYQIMRRYREFWVDRRKRSRPWRRRSLSRVVKRPLTTLSLSSGTSLWWEGFGWIWNGGWKNRILWLFIRLLVELSNTLSFTEYREFNNKFKSVCLFMAHTLIYSIFNLFQLFTRLAKNTHVIRAAQATRIVLYKYVKLVLLVHEDLMHQLQLCMEIDSKNNLFADAPRDN